MLMKCENCGAPLKKLNIHCLYCSHWNVDPSNPQRPPESAAPAVPVPTAPAMAPTPAAPTAPAPTPAAPPAPAPTAVMTPIGAPTASTVAATEKTPAKAEDAPKRFGIRRHADEPAATTATAAPAKTPAKVAPAAPAAPAAKAVSVTARATKETGVSKVDAFRAAMAGSDGAGDWSRGKAVRVSKPDPASVSDEDEAAAAAVEAAAAALYYVATADDDDEMDEDEYDALVGALGEMLGDEADEDALEENIASWDDSLEGDEDAFLAELSGAVGDARAKRNVLQLAVTVAAADGELSDDEEEAAYYLGEHFGFSEDEAERIIERARRRAEEG